MKLLVVDDHPGIVQVLSSIVAHIGHQADNAGGGFEAMERLKSNRYDIVITDAEMPGGDGIKLCKYIKSRFSDVYVIGMSGDPSALHNLGNAGADVCLLKPFGMDELNEAIEKRKHSSLHGLTSLRSVA
jgi:DNA-binding response OmpR family regulator